MIFDKVQAENNNLGRGSTPKIFEYNLGCIIQIFLACVAGRQGGKACAQSDLPRVKQRGGNKTKRLLRERLAFRLSVCEVFNG